MRRFGTQELLKWRPDGPLFGRVVSALKFLLSLPLQLALGVIRRFVQVLFAIFVLVLHPQVKWLWKLIVTSSVVQKYVKPSLQGFINNYYEPYFAYLARLPPYWATFSIALPLAILEPAKLVATIMIAERPKIGILFWLLLQAVSLVLIDRTWTAVRPQSRKIWLVSRVHAWGWLNVSYGKFWIRSSSFYQSLVRWKEQVQRRARIMLSRLSPRRRSRQL
jgi:hypothetical protein